MTKTVLITGANSGIGLETTRALAADGWRTLMLCRNAARADAAVAEIRRTAPDATLEVVLGDLALQSSVRTAAAEVAARTDRLDVLVNNAGIHTRTVARTAEDHDVMLATNQLGPFLLTELLRPLLAAGAPARVVTVASDAHRFAKTVDLEHLDTPEGYGFLGFRRYGETKLMNILWTRELARRLDGTDITANSLHPGGVQSNLGDPASWQRALLKPFMLTAEQGAGTSVFLATDPSLDGVTGGYWAKCVRTDDKRSRGSATMPSPGASGTCASGSPRAEPRHCASALVKGARVGRAAADRPAQHRGAVAWTQRTRRPGRHVVARVRAAPLAEGSHRRGNGAGNGASRVVAQFVRGRAGSMPARNSTSSTSRLPSPAIRDWSMRTAFTGAPTPPEKLADERELDAAASGSEPFLVRIELDSPEAARVA